MLINCRTAYVPWMTELRTLQVMRSCVIFEEVADDCTQQLSVGRRGKKKKEKVTHQPFHKVRYSIADIA